MNKEPQMKTDDMREAVEAVDSFIGSEPHLHYNHSWAENVCSGCGHSASKSRGGLRCAEDCGWQLARNGMNALLALTAENEGLKHGTDKDYACIPRIHHENDKEIYVSQVARIKALESELAAVKLEKDTQTERANSNYAAFKFREEERDALKSENEGLRKLNHHANNIADALKAKCEALKSYSRDSLAQLVVTDQKEFDALKARNEELCSNMNQALRKEQITHEENAALLAVIEGKDARILKVLQSPKCLTIHATDLLEALALTPATVKAKVDAVNGALEKLRALHETVTRCGAGRELLDIVHAADDALAKLDEVCK